MRLIWSPTARRRAVEAVEFIERDRPLVALEWLDGLIARVEALTEFPDQGRVLPEWGHESVREILFEPYRVIYEVFPDEVHVLTLSHFRQELPDL